MIRFFQPGCQTTGVNHVEQGGVQKAYIDLLSRWSYDFFTRCPLPLAFYPTGQISSPWGEGGEVR